MIEIRTPSEDDRDRVEDVLRVSLNTPRSLSQYRAPRLPLEQFRCAFDEDRVVSVAAARAYTQWFGGNELAMSGIWGVGTLPEQRGTGLASRTVGELLHEARERGTPLTALFPATLRPYRRLGYELAGTFTEHTIDLDDLPAGSGPLSVEEYRPEDLPEIRACYREVAAIQNGPIDADEQEWWASRVLAPRDQERVHRVAVAKDEDGRVRGYVKFTHEPAEGALDVAFKLACRHLIASTPEALRSLLGFARGFRGLGKAIEFTGPPASPLGLLVDEQRVLPTWTFRWMLRLLDVPGALEDRGYPPVSGEAVIAVDDPMFADNHGPWKIEADAGKVRVAPFEGPSSRPIAIGTLSSLFSGFVSAWDAARLGLLDAEDPAVPFLAQLFAGPAPFMYDFF